jgi:sec-independent protein translocase protein TatC
MLALRPIVGEQEDRTMPLVEHLAELRARLIWSLAILGAGSLFVFHHSGEVLRWLAKPVGELVFVAPTEAFYTRCRVAVFGGFALTLPLLLHQAWLFAARALSREWRGLLLRLAPLAYVLFLLGSSICVFIVVPAAMKFLLSYGGEGLRPMLTLSSYLDFVTGLALAFGGVFELPLVLYALNRMGLLERGTVMRCRRQVWFLCFVGAAFMTPGPDPISQVALALPAMILFELTVLALR